MKIEGFSQLKKIFHLSDNAKEEEVFTGSIYCVSKITYNFFVFDKFKVQRHTLFNNTIMHQEEFRYLTRLYHVLHFTQLKKLGSYWVFLSMSGSQTDFTIENSLHFAYKDPPERIKLFTTFDEAIKEASYINISKDKQLSSYLCQKNISNFKHEITLNHVIRFFKEYERKNNTIF